MKYRISIWMCMLFAFGCGVKSANELVGVYSVRYQHGAEKLVLNDDGSFVQVYSPNDNGQSTTNSGKWEFKRADREVLLRDALLFDEWGERGKQPLKKTAWRIRITKRFGKISLIIGEEGVLEYDKAK